MYAVQIKNNKKNIEIITQNMKPICTYKFYIILFIVIYILYID